MAADSDPAAGTAARPTALAVAALGLLGAEATAADLVDRFAAIGATLPEATAADALATLGRLGLVRVARVTGETPHYVLTSLGAQAVEDGLLGAAAASLGQLETLRTDLLSTIAHELRTPLTAVRTSAGLLLDPSAHPSDDQRRQMLETIERNAERMQRLVGDILDLARFRAGSIRLQLRPFDASRLAVDVAAAIRPLAERRRQRIDLETPPPGGPNVFGDHRRLEQALLNLASNAQRFAPDDGRIGIKVRERANGERSVAWVVSDDGPGVPVADQIRLFERFFVGRSDRNETREGVGLGLPTALAIAQAHGGTIEVDSEPGRGSRFTLVVPLGGPAGEA